MERLKMAARNYGVLGSPISHSKSPLIHTAAYRVLGLDWQYSRNEVTKGGLRSYIETLDNSWLGLSLTMPLKEEAARFANQLDENARLTGAANTLVKSQVAGQATWTGYNTDVFGIIQAVLGAPSAVLARPIGQVLIVGSGATATSAVTAIRALAPGCTVWLLARNRKTRDELRAYAEQLGLRPKISKSLRRQANSVDLVVSTLPAKALDHTAAKLYDSRRFKPAGVLLDVAYQPWPSALAKAWIHHDSAVISGLEMLIWQAVAQLRIFVNGSADAPLANEIAVVEAMRHDVETESNAKP
jgi:shikimate dehydrogenase